MSMLCFIDMILFFFQMDDIRIRFGFSPSSDVLLMFNIEKFKNRWVTFLFTWKRAGAFEFEI